MKRVTSMPLFRDVICKEEEKKMEKEKELIKEKENEIAARECLNAFKEAMKEFFD